jgi:mono/diheme cytochrome c family protein/glucose/arabinose dehydrogenase
MKPNTSRAFLVAVGVAVAMATVSAFQTSMPNRPWPPDVQPMPPESAPLPPEAALKTFYMPPGYRIELIASEPLIQEPVALDWDLQGRLWAVEMPGFMADLTGSNEHEPIGRVVVLEDVDGDGRMDRRTVFADGLILARSIKVLDRGVLVAEPPNLWLMKDTTGDLKMDTKELVTNQFGRFEGDPQNNANGFVWALDNRMYTAGQADVQLRLKNGAFEVTRTLQRGEWGITQDDAGRIYRNTNESAVHVDLVPTMYYARNPNLVRTRGSYDRLATGNEDLNIVWPVRPNPGTNRAYQTGIDRADGTLFKFTSVCAPLVYRGDRLPSELYGNVFVAEPAANLVGRIVLDQDARGPTARKAYARGEFLASTDERFRPVYITNAPDGTMYIADMYRGIIEHRISITEYLRDQILERKLNTSTGYGRIYRVMHDSSARDLRPPFPASGASSVQLIAALSHPNGWWRDTAQRLLVERNDKSIGPAILALATGSAPWRTRLHALWMLDGLDLIDAGTVTKALQDEAPEIRVAAVRIAERWLGEANHPIQAAVLARTSDTNSWVRQQLAASLGALPPGAKENAVATLLEKAADDPVVMDAAISSLRGVESAALGRLSDAASATSPQKDAAVTMLAATIARAGEDATVQTLLARAADPGAASWTRAAILRGLEINLLGAAMPGNPAGRGASTVSTGKPLPCPTCPGGRAGPGGAYAFARPPDWPSSQSRSGPELRLNREPRAFAALAAGTDSLSPRASAVLAKIVWPGKPGTTAVAPLTADEQQRFEKGRDIYRNICQGCHQPDGRGQDRLAPPLVGSTLALARADIPARILLSGKEGPTGLMPPIGSTIEDEQIASVLTYVRREWGQTGDPVSAAAVAEVRRATADRNRPWKHDELMAMVGK